ncbi:bifunctional glutamine synthetase adenylyltransferase/deadenyltransferase, partial [Cronobacter sakazakii]
MTPLSLPLQQQWQAVVERLPFDAAALSDDARAVLTFSDFVREALSHCGCALSGLEAAPPSPDEWRHYPAWLQTALAEVNDEAALMRALRQFRRRMMTRIAWSQTLKQATTQETLTQLSQLAETLIVAARDWPYAACGREWGTPCNAQ